MNKSTLQFAAGLAAASLAQLAHPSGDYNGDGRDDLVIGVVFQDVGAADDGGIVHVLYGRNSGLSALGDQVWSQNSPGIGDVAENDDRFGGYGITSGDFDGDGRSDLVVGVPFEDLAGPDDVGIVHVIYGDNDGLNKASDDVWSQSSNNVVGDGGLADTFGFSVAAGDFDGDGYDDLAIGVPGETIDGQAGAGAVQVLYGGPGGLTASGSQFFSQNSPGVGETSEVGDNFGHTLVTGDFDGDGRDDLAIGVPFEDGAQANDGLVQVLYGRSSGLSAVGDQVWHQDVAGIANARGNGDGFGRSLAAGDFDGDGHDDLAVAVPFEDIDGVDGAGAVNIIYGSGNGLRATGDDFLSQNTPGVSNSAETADRFGFSMAAGDFDGDGRDDLAVGANEEDIGDIENAGAVHVFYGRNNGLSAQGDQFWHQDKTGITERADPFDFLGWAVTAGDFDSDGRDDLAIGSRDEDYKGVANCGGVMVIYGSNSGLRAIGDQFWAQDSAGIQNAGEANEDLGQSLH